MQHESPSKQESKADGLCHHRNRLKESRSIVQGVLIEPRDAQGDGADTGHNQTIALRPSRIQ